MKFTNKLNLPEYMFDWLSNDNYDYNHQPNTVSATTLLKPLRARVLSERHAKELEIDVSELIASRYGNAIHDSIEKIDTPNVSKEKRITRKVTVGNEVWTVTGKYDVLVDEGEYLTIRDIKTTSVWAYIHGGKDDDYRAQLSIYRWLLSDPKRFAVAEDYKPVNTIANIDFFFTDWQSMKAKTEKGYPRNRIFAGYRIQLNTLDHTETFIKQKLEDMMEYRDTPDDQLPECTDVELWASQDKYAVYKIGNKRATKVCDSQDEAQRYLASATFKEGFIQKRRGEVKRCKYCSVSGFCNQYTKMKAEGRIAEEAGQSE